jgi:hypothetical protein
MTIELSHLKDMLQMEIAADAWWKSLSEKEKNAYLKAHPASRYGNTHKTGADLSSHLEKKGFTKTGKGTWSHKNGTRIRLHKSDTHKHHLEITKKNGDVSTHKTNSGNHAQWYVTKSVKKPIMKGAPKKEAPMKHATRKGAAPVDGDLNKRKKEAPVKKAKSGGVLPSDHSKEAMRRAEKEMKNTPFTKTSPSKMDLYEKHHKKLKSGSTGKPKKAGPPPPKKAAPHSVKKKPADKMPDTKKPEKIKNPAKQNKSPAKAAPKKEAPKKQDKRVSDDWG